MISWLIAFFGELFVISEEWKFYKKKKKRRAYEKENNLPKKRMISPLTQAFVIVPIIIAVVAFMFHSFINPIRQQRDTKHTLLALSYLLHKDKTENGTYPDNIISISRRNPTFGDLTKDAWERAIIYHKTEAGQSYTLMSTGKDGIANTEDDIQL
ncbi:MAG: type II secretion system protein GspG [Bacteroidota bacterium]